jgi:uncharacterized repeat protein (TIGR01451 family)
MMMHRTTAGLPTWWRRALVALMLLILCSCQAVMIPPEDDSEVISDGPPPEVIEAMRADAFPRSLPAELVKSESRELSGEPIAMPQINSRPGQPGTATCGCACCGGGNACSTESCPPDEIIGPGDEYLCDGGDYGLPAAVRADWTVDGLEQEDAVAHYDTLDGSVVVTPSNRVCVYAPRFAAVRRVVSLVAHEHRTQLDVAVEQHAPVRADDMQPVISATQHHVIATNVAERPVNVFRSRQQAGEALRLLGVTDVYSSLGVYANLEVIRTGEVIGAEKAKLAESVQSAVTWSSDQAVQVVFENKQAVALVGVKQPGIVYGTSGPESPRLRLIKLASTYHALPGEEVEFTLRFDNIGDQIIGNVTIVDNLTTRLEYVPDTAKSTVDAAFSSVPNGSGSTVLRWEIEEPLEPGDGGILQFKSRVK